MKSFLFYPYLENGTALMFEARDLPDVDAAAAFAMVLLGEHQTAELVEVWDGDTLHHTARRSPPL